MMESRSQDKDAEIASDSFLTEWLPSELDRYLNRAAISKRRILQRLKLLSLKEKLILDGGCGPGIFGAILAEANRVVGLDISWRSVHLATKRAADAHVRAVGVVGDLEFLPFGDGTFDVCFCGWTLHHFSEVNFVVRELKRVLKPGGMIAFAEPNEGNVAVKLSRFLEDMLRNLVLATGLDVVNRRVHPPSYYVSVLRGLGFRDVRLDSYHSGEVPSLPRIKQAKLGRLGVSIVRCLIVGRNLLFFLTSRILPPPLNGSELLIMATRDDS